MIHRARSYLLEPGTPKLHAGTSSRAAGPIPDASCCHAGPSGITESKPQAQGKADQVPQSPGSCRQGVPCPKPPPAVAGMCGHGAATPCLAAGVKHRRVSSSSPEAAL